MESMMSLPRRVRVSNIGLIEINNGKDEEEKSMKNNGFTEEHHLRGRVAYASIKAYFKEYCNASGVHGVRYLAEDNRLIIEKLFWIIALSLCVAGCSLMIIKVKEKLDTTPVMVSFAETATKVWHVPFPAVTVCPETKSRQTFFNFSKYRKIFHEAWYKNATLEDLNVTLSNETFKKLNALDLVCNYRFADSEKEMIGSHFTIDDDSLKFLQMSTIKPEKTLRCEWELLNTSRQCTSNFKHVWTEQGVCFTFNMLDDNLLFRSHVVNNQLFGDNHSDVGSDWDPDKGYNINAGINSRPWRASHKSGLDVYLKEMEEDVDYICRWASTGYKIIIHSPVELPLVEANLVVNVPFDKEVSISLSPKFMTTSAGLENYDPHKRQCYFSHEKYLQHFRFYTKKSCELECFANETLSLCGCVPFYMPRNSSTKTCGPKSFTCISDMLQKIKKRDIIIDLERRDAGESPSSVITKCDCLPSCVALEYEAAINQNIYAYVSHRRALGHSENDTSQGLHSTIVRVTFKDTEFIATRRSEMYGKIDFLANCGGIVGLFSGFSLVSVIELVYFLTIRLWSNMYRRLKSNRSTVIRRLPANRESVLLGQGRASRRLHGNYVFAVN